MTGVQTCALPIFVIGGGNVAIDTSRVARRLGAESVDQYCLEKREEMPAHSWEVEEEEAEEVKVINSWGVKSILGGDQVNGIELKYCTAVFDSVHRFSPQYDEGTILKPDCDIVIVAAGMGPDTDAFENQLQLNRNRTIQINSDTQQSNVPYIFAAGDVVSGARFRSEEHTSELQ